MSSFEALLPEGPHSAPGAFDDLCAIPLLAPTTLIGQNGADFEQGTKVAVTGCAKPTLRVHRAKVTRHGVKVSFSMSRGGTLLLTGHAFQTLKTSVSAGAHTLSAHLSRAGRTARTRRGRARLMVTFETPEARLSGA